MKIVFKASVEVGNAVITTSLEVPEGKDYSETLREFRQQLASAEFEANIFSAIKACERRTRTPGPSGVPKDLIPPKERYNHK